MRRIRPLRVGERTEMQFALHRTPVAGVKLRPWIAVKVDRRSWSREGHEAINVFRLFS